MKTRTRTKTRTTTTSEPTRQQVALALGANASHREATLRRAVLALRSHLGPLAVASVYAGDAVELAGLATVRAPPFLNTVAVGPISTRWQPEDVLALVKAMELAAGRGLDARYAQRPLDIDVLWVGHHQRTDDALGLPHRALLQRRFVLAPLAEIDPDLALPHCDVTAAEALEALPASAPPVTKRSWHPPLPNRSR